MTGTPHLTETPADALGELIRDNVIIDGRSFLIERPAETDRIIDHPAMRSAFAADEFLPYWADLWPASRMLARAILRGQWAPQTTALDIGCGLGLAGIAALAKGLRVTFSDCDRTALRFAAANARLNGFRDYELLLMDWRHPPVGRTFSLLLASDVCYEQRHIEPVVNLICELLAPDGTCLLTDPDRPPAALLRETLSARGLHWTTALMRAGEPGGERYKGTLYRITKAEPQR